MSEKEQSVELELNPGATAIIGIVLLQQFLTLLLNIAMIYPLLTIGFNILNIPTEAFSFQSVAGCIVLLGVEKVWKKLWSDKYKFTSYAILYGLCSYYLFTHPTLLSSNWTLAVHIALINAVIGMVLIGALSVMAAPLLEKLEKKKEK